MGCFIAVKADDCMEQVEALVKNCGEMGCRVSLKVHPYILDAHLDNFKGIMREYSEEQRERLHQDIMEFEQRCQGAFHENMLEDYIWGLIHGSDDLYSHKSRKA